MEHWKTILTEEERQQRAKFLYERIDSLEDMKYQTSDRAERDAMEEEIIENLAVLDILGYPEREPDPDFGK